MKKEGLDALGPHEIFELLLEKLNRRGILLVQTPRFIKDVMNIIAENPSVAEESVNSRMVRLGWGEQVLDGYILELVRFLNENHNTPVSHATRPVTPASQHAMSG